MNRQRRTSQTKTRGGCATCKAKRLKCDEGKPECRRCVQKGIPCGGYEQKLKWKFFEDSPELRKINAREEHRAEGKRQRRSSSASAASPAPSQVFDFDAFNPDPVEECTENLFDGIALYDSKTKPMKFSSPQKTDTEDDVFDTLSPGAASSLLSDLDSSSWEQALVEPSNALTIPQSYSWPPIHMPLNKMDQLLHFYDIRTCGILSVSDALSENGWRDLLLPMALSNDALCNALQALTAFHMASLKPELRLQGIKHARQSMEKLSTAISAPSSSGLLTTIATTLVLCMAEVWDKKVTHGNAHVQGAHQLIQRHLTSNAWRTNLNRREMSFLFNTFLYMDVISSLTNDTVPLSAALSTQPIKSPQLGPSKVEIDPLLGCSVSLFPILAKAIALANMLRNYDFSLHLDQKAISYLSQAITVRDELIEWTLPPNDPDAFTWVPNDPNCDLNDIIMSAEAYRLCGLLYLYNALPPIVCEQHTPPSKLTLQILNILKGIPASSKTMTVHIWPTIAASVDAIGRDRLWIEERFNQMRRQLCLGNCDSAWEVIVECWRRRDMAGDISWIERGCEWLNVCHDWQWKLFLG